MCPENYFFYSILCLNPPGLLSRSASSIGITLEEQLETELGFALQHIEIALKKKDNYRFLQGRAKQNFVLVSFPCVTAFQLQQRSSLIFFPLRSVTLDFSKVITSSQQYKQDNKAQTWVLVSGRKLSAKWHVLHIHTESALFGLKTTHCSC